MVKTSLVGHSFYGLFGDRYSHKFFLRFLDVFSLYPFRNEWQTWAGTFGQNFLVKRKQMSTGTFFVLTNSRCSSMQ